MLHYDFKNDHEDERETIPVFQAIERGNLRGVGQFLAEGGGVESRNADGQTLLAAAAIYSWPKIVRLLLDHSADPERSRRARPNAAPPRGHALARQHEVACWRPEPM